MKVKKMLTLMLVMVLVCFITVSCADSVDSEVEKKAGKIAVSSNKSSKGLVSEVVLDSAGNLYWSYEAERTDGGFYITGKTSEETWMQNKKGVSENVLPIKGLPSDLGLFSYGKWKIKVKAYSTYTDALTNVLVYEGSEEVNVCADLNEITVELELKQENEGAMKIASDGLAFELDELYNGKKLSLEMYDSANLIAKTVNDVVVSDGKAVFFGNNVKVEGSYPAISLDNWVCVSGEHALTFRLVYDRGDMYLTPSDRYEVVSTENVVCNVYDGMTTEIGGTFGRDEEKGIIVLYVSTSVNGTTVAGSAVSTTANSNTLSIVKKENDGSETLLGSVKLPKSSTGSAVKYGTGSVADTPIVEGDMLSLTIEQKPDSDFAVEIADVTSKTALLPFDIDFKVNDLTVESCSEEITVELFIGKGLSDGGFKGLYHKGVAVSGAIYNAATGIVTFKTTSFSEYTVAVDADVLIGETFYVSVFDGFSAVHDMATEVGATKYNLFAATVTLVRDCNIDIVNKAVEVEENESITIDLNGHRIVGVASTGKTSALISNKGVLTLKDGSDVNKDGSGKGKIVVGATESWTWNGVAGDYAGSYASNLVHNPTGILVVESGYYENIGKGSGSSANYVVDSGAGSKTTIKGGKLVGVGTAVRAAAGYTGRTENAVVNVEGGYIVGGYSALYAQLPSSTGKVGVTITITGGTFEARNSSSYVIYDWTGGQSLENTSYTISGGNFKGSYVFFTYGAKADISGGYFDGYLYDKKNGLSISGGTFTDRDFAPAYVDSDCSISDNGDGTFSVVHNQG